jgi:hypothetical protein
MKKFAIIFLISIYATSTFGLNVKQFYCCGKLKSITVSIGTETVNKCKRHDDTRNCCKTKFQFYKVKDTHFANDFLTLPAKYFDKLPVCSCSADIHFTPFKKPVILNSNHAPPLFNGVPVFISNCVYRI